MAALLKDAEASTFHPVEEAARFHLRFEGVHPFIDGNGRTGRLLLNMELMRAGYLPIDVKYADRRRCYDAFGAYDRMGDAAPMISLIASYAEKRLKEYLAAVKGIDE